MPPGALRARAAWVAAAGLLAAAAPGSAPAPVACAGPSEAEARDGHTRVARCDAPRGRPLRGPARRLFGLPLDPNRADPRTLEILPGIGPVRAAAIVRERERGAFASVGELLRVPGIGPRTLERVAPLLAVGEGA